MLVVSVFAVSCDTDGGTSELDLRVGAVPNFVLNTEYPTILNLNQLSTGAVVDFGFTVDIAQGNVASADVVGFYQTAAGEMYGPVTLRSGVTEFPLEMVLSTDDLISAFSELSSNDDFSLGDELLVTTKLYLEDGTELDLWDEEGRLYGSDIHTSSVYDVVANYPVGCPLNGLFTGEYLMTVEGAGAFGAFADDQVVTFEETSQTIRTFTIPYLPGAGGFSTNVPLNFVCETLLIPVVDSGVGCGGGTITFGSTDDGIIIDPADDSGFTLTITDFITDGGCGASSYEVTLTFVKQ